MKITEKAARSAAVLLFNSCVNDLNVGNNGRIFTSNAHISLFLTGSLQKLHLVRMHFITEIIYYTLYFESNGF